MGRPGTEGRDPRLGAMAAELGIGYDELIAQLTTRAHRLTVTELLPQFLMGLTPGTARTYKSPLVFLRDGWSVSADLVGDVTTRAKEAGLRFGADALTPAPSLPRPEEILPADGGGQATHVRIVEGYGHRPIESISSIDLMVMAKWVRLRAQLHEAVKVERRKARGALEADLGYDGRSAQETFVAATRAFFKAARTHPGVDLAVNPGAELTKPRRGRRKRRPLSDLEFEQAYEVVSSTGRDVVLDELLFRFHAISAARREGALNLTLRRLDPERCTAILDEKDDTIREQPIPPSLCARLIEFAHERGATEPYDAVFRTAAGVPMTDRHYDSIHKRVQERYKWAAERKWDIHTLRVTIGARVERTFGHAVAEAYLGHTPKTPTDDYVQATLEEVVEAMVHHSGEDHPLRQRST